MVTSEQSAARDAAAIASGIPSRALMQRAGAALAAELALRHGMHVEGGVVVYTGPGNNGGDGWVVARALATTGAPVRVVEVLPAKSADAAAERALTLPFVHVAAGGDFDVGSEPIVIDAMLGTGSSGAPRGAIADAVAAINGARNRSRTIVAVDVPTGVDATTGDASAAVVADLTITFGTVKRGHLIARQQCGEIVVVDVGLGEYASRDDAAPSLVDERWIARAIPPIPADAHKGTRRKLAIVGGAPGMAGATVLAARAAMRTGIGMVKLVVAPESLPVVQTAEPLALAGTWPNDGAALEREIASWADAIVIGPGLGRGSRALVDRVLTGWSGPVLLDADALNVFDGDLDALARGIGRRPALLTPHPVEFARLMGGSVGDVLARRFEIGRELARRSGATVLLKGVPTVVTSPNGDALVTATGTPVLAAAGSGDVLSGIAGTLLAQTGDASVAGAVGAWIHGRAAELAPGHVRLSELRAAHGVPSPTLLAGLPPTRVRGLTLEDVLDAIPLGWPSVGRAHLPRYPVLHRLPAVGERR